MKKLKTKKVKKSGPKKGDFEYYLKKPRLVVKNPHVFEISYPPDEIVKRREYKELFKEISNTVIYNTPNNILVLGNPGSGKTVIAKYIRKIIDRERTDVNTYYINCRDKTGRDILKELIGIINGHAVTRSRLINEFLLSLNKNNIIILDEIDQGKKLNDILYNFSRSKEVSNRKETISLLLISNDLDWIEKLDPPISSSLQLRVILFKPYKASEIYEILKGRIKKGFTKEALVRLDDNLIKGFSKVIEKEKRGDCRLAIGGIFYAAQTAESKNRKEITQEDLERGFNYSVRESQKSRIEKLNHKQFFVLYSIFQSKKNTYNEIYETYLNFLDDFPLKPLRKTMFYYLIEYLADQDIVVKQLKKDSNVRGKEYEIETKIDKGVVEEEFHKRLIYLLKTSS